LFILAIVLVLCIFFGVDDELSSALIYQTSFGVTGGINKFKSQSCGNGISMTTCSTIETIKATILVSSTNKFQSIIGFGGAFTESAGYVFSKLSTKTQDKVIELYFGESGIGFTLGRIHINSCDFSLSSYNYDDQLDDFDLDHFDSGLIRDSMYVIPLIRLAMAASSLPILLVASPWSPPAWMKVSHPMSAHVSDTQQYWQAMTGSAQPHGLRDDARVKTAWAMYIAKFLEAYSAKGVPVWAVTPQNEPEFAAPWEACVFNASYEGAFIAGYLGPVLRERLPQVKILGFDHNKDHLLQWAQVLMGDPTVEPFLDGMAFHCESSPPLASGLITSHPFSLVHRVRWQ
jgi:glucosylceramidase